MTWDVGYAILYATVAFAIANIFCSAPDNMRKGALGLAAIGFLSMYSYHIAQVAGSFGGFEAHWQIHDMGQQLVVCAAILEIIRILFIERLHARDSRGDRIFLGCD